VKKIKIPQLKFPKDLEKYRSELTDQLLQNPSVQDFLKENNLDENFINDHLLGLMQIEEENQVCLTCPGYAHCKKSPRGLLTTMCEIDGFWEISYKNCEPYEEVKVLLDNYLYYDFDDEWLKTSLDNVSLNFARRKLVTEAINLLKEKTSEGLYVYGAGGVGKSYILAALTNDLIRIYGKKVAFINVRSFIEDCKLSFDMKNVGDYVGERIKELQQVDVLVLDDLGGEKVSEWSTHSVLYDIIEYRARRRLLTLYSSRYSQSQLYGIYGGKNPRTDRFIEQLALTGREIEVRGLDLNK
jgi:primosomal protein DnaI